MPISVAQIPSTTVPAEPAPNEDALLDRSTPFIDATAAGPQIAAPAAPELADADETLAGAPNVPPAAPAPTPGTVVSPSATPAEAGAGAFSASQEQIQAAKDKAAAGAEFDDVERQRLEQAQRDEEDIAVQRRLEAQAQQDARDDFMAKKNAADEKVRDFKFQDYFDNPKHGSKALARFAVFLGGLGNLGGQAPGAPNRALDGLEQDIKADHDEQLAYLNSAKYFADKQAEGVTDLLKQQQSDRQQAELDYANKKLATADRFAALAQTARGKINKAAADEEVAKLKKSAYDDQQKVFDEIARQKLEDARGQAALAKAKRHTGGGGTNTPAFDAFVAAASALKPGDPITPEVANLALKAGIKQLKIADQVKAYARGANPVSAGRGGTAPGELPKDAVVYNGKPIGLAPSGRGGAAAFEQQLIAYDDGLKSLEELKQYAETNPLGRVPKGDKYDRAVLAIAATTTANPSDATTKHEANTLKGLATVDPAAIQRSIDHIKERRDAKIGTLRPLPKQASAPTAAQSAAIERLTALGVQFGG